MRRLPFRDARAVALITIARSADQKCSNPPWNFTWWSHVCNHLSLAVQHEGFSTYYRMCSNCGLKYHYQEWTDGLNNFDVHLLMSLHMCIILRHSLQTHHAISRAVEVLETTAQQKFHTVVVMDLHKKAAFNMPVSDIPAPPPEYDGRVNMKDFWASVTAKIVCQGLLDSEATASNGTPAATASDGTPASVARLMCAEREIKDFRLWECPKTLLPASVLEDIFIDVVLQEGDEAILTLALVCTRFRDLVTREAFRRRAHFLWLDSVTNWSAFSTYYKAEYYKMYRLQTCMQCGDILKNCIPGYVGRGRRGELIKIISEDTHPDFCSEFCQICADFI